MIIVNDLGPVDHAWLDASLLDPTCSGLRCRLVVGEHGGIVCDMVAGTPEAWIADDMMARVASSVATHAVLNTDPRSIDPLPIEDGSGRIARIVVDAGDARDMAVPTRRTASLSDESVACGESSPRSHARSFTGRAAAYGLLAVVAAVIGLAVHQREDASTGIMLFVAGVLAAGGIKWLRKAKEEKLDHPGRMTRHAESMRELERRARLPDALTD
jgi:hypothetical protein